MKLQEIDKSNIQEIKKTCCWVNEKKIAKQFLQRRLTMMFIFFFIAIVALIKYDVYLDKKDYCEMLAEAGQKLRPQEQVTCRQFISR